MRSRPNPSKKTRSYTLIPPNSSRCNAFYPARKVAEADEEEAVGEAEDEAARPAVEADSAAVPAAFAADRAVSAEDLAADFAVEEGEVAAVFEARAAVRAAEDFVDAAVEVIKWRARRFVYLCAREEMHSDRSWMMIWNNRNNKMYALSQDAFFHSFFWLVLFLKNLRYFIKACTTALAFKFFKSV